MKNSMAFNRGWSFPYIIGGIVTAVFSTVDFSTGTPTGYLSSAIYMVVVVLCNIAAEIVYTRNAILDCHEENKKK